MPVIDVNIDTAARAAYLDVYKAAAIATVNDRVSQVINDNFARTGFLELVYQHRAVQAFTYLADADRDANIARYPLIESGIGSYGLTRQQVAESYIGYNNSLSAQIVALYEDHRHLVNEQIPAQDSKTHIDTLVAAFLAGWA